jgi:hypothetical protein
MPIYLVLVSSLVALSAQGPAGGPATKAPDDGVHRFTLVYTVNGFGVVEPTGCPHKILHDGGVPRRMTCIREIDAAEGPLLIVDGGAAIFPEIDKAPDADREKLLTKAELLVETQNRVHCAAMGIGTNDLLLGISELSLIAKGARFPFLCANLETPTGNPFKPYTIVEVAGVRIGLIGLLTDTLGKVYLERVVPGGKLGDPVAAARKSVAELRGNADMIIALSHCRMDANRKMASEVEGIDLIIDPSIEYGSHHAHIRDEDWEETVGRTVIFRGDGHYTVLGVVTVEFRKAGAGTASRLRLEALQAEEKEGTLDSNEKQELKDIPGRNLVALRKLPLAAHYADDAEGAALLDAWKSGGDVMKVAARTAPAFRENYLTAQGCKECHEKQYANWAGSKHAHAFEGIVATGTARKPECLSCHVTGYGPGFIDPAEATTFGGVQCEACHGTSPGHVQDPAANKFPSIAESTCLPCHNEDVVKGTNFSFMSGLQKVKCPKGIDPPKGK